MKKTLKFLSVLWILSLVFNTLAFATDAKELNFNYTDEQESEAYDYVTNFLISRDYEVNGRLFNPADEDISLTISYIDNENRIYVYNIFDYAEDFECILGDYHEEYSYCVIDCYCATYGYAYSYVINGEQFGSLHQMDDNGLVPDEVFEMILSRFSGYRKISGDINTDEVIDIVDVAIARSYIVGEIEPVSCITEDGETIILLVSTDVYNDMYKDVDFSDGNATGCIPETFIEPDDILKGDMNGDEVLDIIDVAMMRSAIVG